MMNTSVAITSRRRNVSAIYNAELMSIAVTFNTIARKCQEQRQKFSRRKRYVQPQHKAVARGCYGC